MTWKKIEEMDVDYKYTPTDMKEKITTELESTKRDGIVSVINFLKNSDYFSAPASTAFHNVSIGGLAKHSWNVMQVMRLLNSTVLNNVNKPYDDGSIVIVGTLHDICKVNTYKPNLLKSGDISTSKPYKKEDTFPIGHGEKSVIMLLNLGLKLTEDEMLAIRYHMNMFDSAGYRDKANWNELSILAFVADYFTSTFLDSKFEK